MVGRLGLRRERQARVYSHVHSGKPRLYLPALSCILPRVYPAALPITQPVFPQRGASRVTASNPLLAAARTTVALMLREMSTRYGRTPGGYLWAIIQPMGVIGIMSLAFSMVLRTPPLGVSFVLFYASGFLPFTVYSTIESNVAHAINFSRALLDYPAVKWIDAALARFFLNALTGYLVVYLLLTGILMAIEPQGVPDMAPIIQALALVSLLGFGVGLVNCALFGLFPIWQKLWSIATTPLFLASGVVFTYDSLPRAVQEVMWYNPLIHVIGLMRKGIYPTYSGQYINELYVLGLSLVLVFFGVVLLGRYHREILDA